MSRPVATHLYQPDPAMTPDHRGRRPCTCGMPRGNRAHDVPDTSDATALDARRLGERTETP